MSLDLREEAAAESHIASPPRARGTLVVSSKARPGSKAGVPDTSDPSGGVSALNKIRAPGCVSALDKLRASGAMRALFPRRSDAVEAIMINTSGGLTGGDRISVEAEAGCNSTLCLTTQAAERAYRAASGTAQMRSTLRVAAGAELLWLPQELILFEGARLSRHLRCDMQRDARLLLVEPVIFGRAASGEHLTDVTFRDRIEIWRDAAPLYFDATRLEGCLRTQMARKALGDGAGAMAQLLYVAPDAEAHLPHVRHMLPDSAGASLLHPDCLVLRCLAPDGHALRKTLLPVLDRLSRDRLPTSWRL